MIRSPAKQSGIEPVFSKTTKQQELGVAVHAPAKSGIWLILDATSKKAKRKAPLRKQKEKHRTSNEVQCFFGGEYRDRTGDLLHAMQALSQLS